MIVPPVFEQQMTRIIPSFAGFTAFVPTVPKIYWNVRSQEQRILGICEMLDKVICYADMLGENVDEITKIMQEILDGKLDPMIEAAIVAWFDENEPQIVADIADLKERMGTAEDDIDNLQTDVGNMQTDVGNLQTDVGNLQNDIKYVQVNNNVFDSSNRAQLSLSKYDGKAYMSVSMDLSNNTIENTSFNGLSLKEIFEDGNLIELTDSYIRWDGGNGTLNNASIITTGNNLPTLSFESHSAQQSIVTLPSRAFLRGHIYVCFGQYQMRRYNTGFAGIRSVNRFMFAPFAESIYRNFVYVVGTPATESNSYYQDDAIYLDTTQIMKFGVFYDDYALTQPDIDMRLRLFGLIDITTLFNTTPSIQDVSTAFDEYCAIKLGNTTKVFRTELMPANIYSASTNVETFMNMMRFRAYSLGVTDAKWYTPSGFSLNQSIENADYLNYGTVKDLLKFGVAAMSNNVIQWIMSMGNTPLVSFGKRAFNNSEFVTNDTSDYPYSIYENDIIKRINNTTPGALPYDILIYKGGSLGSASKRVPWSLATPEIGIFYNYVGLTEFKDNLVMAFAILGCKSYSYTVFNLVYGIQQYMLQMYANGGAELTDEQKEALATGQPLYAQLQALESDEEQNMAWGAMIMPAASAAFNGLSQTQMFADYSVNPYYMSHFENDTKIYPFLSTSKLLTCMLTVESCIDLSELHEVVQDDIVGGSGFVLRPGMLVSCRDLMCRALWSSDNDACQMLARIVGKTWRNNYYLSNVPSAG